jgi:hypothetical protein
MPIAPLARRIKFHVRRVRVLKRTALRLHARARNVAARALAASAAGYHRHAKQVIRRALRLKARAARTGVRAVFHGGRVVRLRALRRQAAIKHGA